MNDEEILVTNVQNLEHVGPGCYVSVDKGNTSCWVEVKESYGALLCGEVHHELSPVDCVHKCRLNKMHFYRHSITALGCDIYCSC